MRIVLNLSKAGQHVYISRGFSGPSGYFIRYSKVSKIRLFLSFTPRLANILERISEGIVL